MTGYSSSSVICQTTGPKPLAKRFLHIVRSRASSFNSQYPLLSLRSSSNFLRLLPCLLVTSICPFIFPSITCFRRQFLRKMWPIQLAFRFIISWRIFLCLYTSSFLTWSVQLIFSILLQHHISKDWVLLSKKMHVLCIVLAANTFFSWFGPLLPESLLPLLCTVGITVCSEIHTKHTTAGELNSPIPNKSDMAAHISHKYILVSKTWNCLMFSPVVFYI